MINAPSASNAPTSQPAGPCLEETKGPRDNPTSNGGDGGTDAERC